MDSMSIRPRGIGEILDGAFRLYKEDVGLYVFTALLASLPWALFAVAAVGDSDGAAVLAVILIPLALLLTTAVWGALMHQMNERLDGREPSLGPSMKLGVRRFFRIAWGAILAYIVFFGGFMVAFMVPGLVIAIAAAVDVGTVGRLVIMILAFAAMVYLLVKVTLRAFAGTVLFLPGIIVEGLTAFDSLKRGFTLSKGGRGRIVTVVVLSWILIFVPFMATYFITGTTASLYDPEAMASGVISTGQFAAQQVLGMIASGFTTPFLVACVLLLYYDQRVRLEAYDLEAEAEALGG